MSFHVGCRGVTGLGPSTRCSREGSRPPLDERAHPSTPPPAYAKVQPRAEAVLCGNQLEVVAEEERVRSSVLERTVNYLEVAMAGILVVITALTVGGLIIEIARTTAATVPGLEAVSRAEFTRIISHVLEVFIVIELFRIAVAYMTHQNVIPTVLEAALVAIARKFVVFEPALKGNPFWDAAGLSLLLLSVGVAWWLLSRAHACELPSE